MGRIGRIMLLALGALLAAAPAARARDATVNSFDGTPIITHFFPAPNLGAGETAPTIMLGHGWGLTGATSPPAHYADAGYNVLTWDARGFGGSGGTVMIDHPEFEARDAQALIDFIAQQPEAELDAANDPRVGMDGPSYGGGVQFITAARDDRIDAIAPTIAWNSLLTSLYKSNAIKLGWAGPLAAIGIPTSLVQGVFSPAGIQLGNQSPQFFSLVTNGAATGRFLPADVSWLDEHGPNHLLPQISAPTLIAEGTVDTLFTLDEAHRNFTALKAQGVPVKMMWFCGGHGACLTGTDTGDPLSGLAGDGGRVQERKLAWFARWLKGEQVDTGPEFEWIDEEGVWHESAGYPLQDAGSVSGSGSGTIVLVPGANPSGLLIFATPAVANLVSIPIETPPVGSDVVGEPQLELSYTATGVSAAADGKTHIFAQLVDKQRNLVVNNLATPIPIELDGQPHQLSIPLERIASLSTASGYELQLIHQTNVYDAQRAAGAVQVTSADVTVPLAQPIAAGEGGGGDSGAATPAACANLLRGSKKRDRLTGTEGPDRLQGRGGRDRIRGLGGDDCLAGGGGRDRLFAGDGDDMIKAARGGRDRIKCGAGRDTAEVRPGVDRWKNCEVVVKRRKRR